MQPDLLSVVLRLHTTEGNALPFLSNALLSLAGGIHAPLEAIVVTQQFSSSQIQEVEALINRFVWRQSCQARVVNFSSPEKKDHRSALLNTGMDAANGQYLALLDYDDYVYEHAYSTLISQLKRSSSAVAFGGCFLTYAVPTPNGYKVIKKSNPWLGKGEADFLKENMFPIHSFVMDRVRLGDTLPRFNEALIRCEDHEFLMRLRMVTDFDVTHLGQILFEYVMREDGTNTIVTPGQPLSPSNNAAWTAAYAAVEPIQKLLKEHLMME